MHTFAKILRVNYIIMRYIILFCVLLFASNASAQNDSTRIYSEQNPLIYEDVRDLWPYSFINEDGEPDGYNIELVRSLMHKLHIPYDIQLKTQQEVIQDLKTHNADLGIGLASGYNDQTLQFGRTLVLLLTQSVATNKSKSVEIKTFRDLSKSNVKVTVCENSFCHQLMTDYGWDKNLIVSQNIKKELQIVNDKGEGQIVWSTPALKYLTKHMGLKDIKISPVNMPHGEYKFIASDKQLLDKIDLAYSGLDVAEEIDLLENKWFYPDREMVKMPEWVRNLIIAALILMIGGIVYFIIFRLKDKREMEANLMLNRRLALIIETCKVRLWTYDVEKKMFAWHNEHGEISCTYSINEFAKRYKKGDFEKLNDALDRLINQNNDARGHEEEELTLELKAKDVEGGDQNMHDFIVVVAVLNRDKNGKPTTIIGTKKDVTEACNINQEIAARSLRYWSMFYSPIAAVLYFNKEGYMQNASPKACELYEFEIDEMVKKRIHINDFYNIVSTDLRELDQFEGMQIYKEKCIKYKLGVACNDDELIGVFVFCKAV